MSPLIKYIKSHNSLSIPSPFSLLAFLCLLFVSCGKEELNVIEIMPYEVRWEVPAGLNSFETHFFTFRQMETNRTQFFSSRSLASFTTIRPRKAQLELLRPSQNFDALRTVEVWVESTREGASSYEVFYTLDLRNENNRQIIDLIPSLSDIRPLYEGDFMEVEVRLNFHRLTNQIIPVRLYWEFEAVE